MQNRNTNNYLIRRVTQVLRIEKLEPKDLPLDMLMTAYASLRDDGADGNDQRITMKVPALATYYAGLLMDGKFVVINDIMDATWYFVKAHDGDLIAVSHAVGPWLNLYSIKSTKEETLHALKITTPNTSDLKIIDRIFGFRPWNEVEAEQDSSTLVVTHDEPSAHWQWHTGSKPAKKSESDKGSDLRDALKGRTELVTASGHVIETSAEPVGEPNQMERAFQAAGQHSRSDNRQHERDTRRTQDQRSQHDKK